MPPSFRTSTGAVAAVELSLSREELSYLEQPYLPHALVGVMAQNTATAAGQPTGLVAPKIVSPVFFKTAPTAQKSQAFVRLLLSYYRCTDSP